jgi:ATP-dependent exoDNAse (exonuclease V) beta subunit
MNQPHGSRSHPDLLIRASAGTGKTFQLSNRYIHLLRDGIPCDRILATTFTRKAAGEILDRIVTRLAEAANDNSTLDELGEFTGQRPLNREECLGLLEQLMHNLHRLRISTLDSFFSLLARSYSLELGLPPRWQIVEELDDARLRSQAIEAILAQDDPSRLKTLLNLLTKGAADRGVSSLIRSTVDSLYGLFLETDADAWRQVPRFATLSETELDETLEDLRTLELSDPRFQKARDADYDLAVAGAWSTMLSKGLAAKVLAGENEYHRKPIPAHAIRLYEKLLAHARGVQIGLVAMQTEASYQLLQRFHDEYHHRKQNAQAMRFEDVTRRLNDLRQLYDASHLAFRLDGHVEHLLLDEFQDTSPEQWRVIRPLAERVTDGCSTRSFFCVGDVKQAIYGWRGGVAEIFDAIDRQLDGLVSESLNVSYRSSPPIIQAVNEIFAGLPRHNNLGRAATAVGRWCDRFPEHKTACKDLPGYVELVTATAAEADETPGEAAIRYAAEKVAQLVRQAPGCEVGVLVRTNKNVGRLIYHLRRLDVPASEEGGNPLTDSAAVNVVLSLLQMTDHPGDTVARFHVAKSPLGPALDLVDYEDGEAARRLVQTVRRSLVDRGYGRTIFAWAEHLAPACNRRELSRLKQLIQLAYGYQSNATLRTSDFVEFVETQRVSDATPASVRVMTVHQAKGLEFDIVVLPDLDVGLIGQASAFVVDRPDPAGPVVKVCRYAATEVQALMPPETKKMFTDAEQRSVTESLCVLYVALTRARHALHMIVAPSAPNERTIRASYAGLLRAALTDLSRIEPACLLYDTGDPRWYEHAGKGESREREPIVPTAAAPVHVQLAPLAAPRQRGWERARPSGLEGGSVARLQPLFRSGRSGALVRGQLIHAFFEQIVWINDGTPSEDKLREVADELLSDTTVSRNERDQWRRQFLAMLQRDSIREILSRQRYRRMTPLGFPPQCDVELAGQVPVAGAENERSFAIRDGGQLLTGFIDRLVLLSSDGRVIGAEILDYKTDAVDPQDEDDVAAKVDHYRPQLQAYRRAVSKLTYLPMERILASLIFVESGLVRSVDSSDGG